jgi:hypothetical protein
MEAKSECCGWASWGELAGMTSSECPTEWSLETERPCPTGQSAEPTEVNPPTVTARRATGEDPGA